MMVLPTHTIYFDDARYVRLTDLARRKKKSFSTVVREVLDAGLSVVEKRAA